jgi:GntR family transcriptional regulator
MVVADSPIPLYIQIEEELRGMIQAGELGPNDRVPSESELSERFSVSRMTARKALDRLVADGLMFRRAGKGTFVAQPKIAHGPSQLLSFSAAMDAQDVEHHTKVLDARMLTAPSNIAGDLQVAPGASVAFVRRLRFIGDEPAAIHMSYIPARFSSVLDGDLTGSMTRLLDSVGAKVARTNDTIEAVAASGDEARLLRVRAGSPLVLIVGVAYTSDLVPVRHSEALYRGDRFRFRVDTTGQPELRVEPKEPTESS